MLWKGFQRPNRLEVDEEKGNYGRFTAQPLERGWGTTVGNALRRHELPEVRRVHVVHRDVIIKSVLPGARLVRHGGADLLRLAAGSSRETHGELPCRTDPRGRVCRAFRPHSSPA